MTREETAKIISVLIASYRQSFARADRAEIESMIEVWFRKLHDLPYALVDKAVDVIIDTSRFVPSIADVRAQAAELTSPLPKTGAEAWGAVVRAISAQGYDRTPGVDFVFYDPLTVLVVQALGWRELCHSENQVADRARFIEAYEKLAMQAKREAVSGTLRAAQEAKRAALPEGRGTTSIGGAIAALRLVPGDKGESCP